MSLLYIMKYQKEILLINKEKEFAIFGYTKYKRLDR